MYYYLKVVWNVWIDYYNHDYFYKSLSKSLRLVNCNTVIVYEEIEIDIRY